MINLIKYIYQFLVDLLCYVPEQWHNNKWFWIFWIVASALVTGGFVYVFG